MYQDPQDPRKSLRLIHLYLHSGVPTLMIGHPGLMVYKLLQVKNIDVVMKAVRVL